MGKCPESEEERGHKLCQEHVDYPWFMDPQILENLCYNETQFSLKKNKDFQRKLNLGKIS